jgi:hypothetical protein
MDMDDNDDWPVPAAATPMDIQCTFPDPTMPHIADPVADKLKRMAVNKKITSTTQAQVTPMRKLVVRHYKQRSRRGSHQQ